MNEFEYIIKSLENIDSHYYKVMGVSIDREYQQAAENAFTAELYYQLKTYQVDYSDDKLLWHFDLNKERAFSIRPDLVLHKFPNDRDDQRIYVEIKTNKNTDDQEIKKDLIKLINAVSDDNKSKNLGFFIAFYIIGNINLNLKKEVFKTTFSEVDKTILEKINVIYFDSNKYQPQQIELNSLLK